MKLNVKKWFHSLSVWFANAQIFIGLGLLLIEQQFNLIAPYLGEWSGAVLMAIGLVNLWLRFRTNSAIAGTKAAKPPAEETSA